MNVFRPLALLLCLSFAGLSSCINRDDLIGLYTLENDCWEKGHDVCYQFEVADTSITYDLYLEVLHTSLYPYQNIWIFLNTETPIGTIQRDTLGMSLADEQGRWLTPSAMFVHRCRFHVANDRRFPHPGRYHFAVRQGMRTDTLEGVRYISFSLRKH
ncbi:MAG: gliding motility lipoprotein GldH [Tannerellaceae bacterium]|jgi:gliding motility-associated lipoprotein GldH|nr:gliding motility lipoprotein GldH [Tannerellaceae bacterium]